MLERINIHVEVPLVDFRELTSDAITGNEVLEAIQFRSLDRQLFH